VLPAMFTVFDCIISDRRVGQAIAFCAYQPRCSTPAFGIRRGRSRKRDDSRSATCGFFRLRVAPCVHDSTIEFWSRGSSALVGCLPPAQFATPLRASSPPVAGIFLPLLD
jgi:hypothetical protein